MSSVRPSSNRFALMLLALAALVLASTLLPMPARAAKASGEAVIVLAKHDRGRTLSGQGVKVLPGGPGTQADRTLGLPISAVGFLDPGGIASAGSDGWLRFKKGKRSLPLSEISFNLSAGTVSGKLGDEKIDVFKVNGPASANRSSGNVTLDGGKLTLTAGAASALKEALGLKRALRRNGVGMAWLAAKADPAHEAAVEVASGTVEWGVLASWRGYILANVPPPPPTNGTIEVVDGATATGPLSSPASIFDFPAMSGSFQRGLYGATDKLALQAAGGVVFKKPGHCIVEVALSDPEVKIDGASSSLTLDARYDTDGGPPHVCNVNLPTVTTEDVEFATLDLSTVTPASSNGGKTTVWSAISVTLTEAGASAFGAGYEAGQPLDPITVSVTTG